MGQFIDRCLVIDRKTSLYNCNWELSCLDKDVFFMPYQVIKESILFWIDLLPPMLLCILKMGKKDNALKAKLNQNRSISE